MMTAEMWKESWECVKAQLEKEREEHKAIVEKKNQEIRKLVEIIKRGGK